jgi:hypothetical protein
MRGHRRCLPGRTPDPPAGAVPGVRCGVGVRLRATVSRMLGTPPRVVSIEGGLVGSVIKKRRKRMAKKKHRKLLRKTRVQRRNKK